MTDRAIPADEALSTLVRTYVADHFGLPLDAVTRATTAGDVAGWDSLANAEIILGLEDRLGVEIEPAELTRLTDVGALIDALAASRRP